MVFLYKKNNVIRVAKVIISIGFFSYAMVCACPEVSHSAPHNLAQQTLFSSLDNEDVFSRVLSSWISICRSKGVLFADIPLAGAEDLLKGIERQSVSILPDAFQYAKNTVEIPNGAQYGQVFIRVGERVLRAYVPGMNDSRFPHNDFTRIWDIEGNEHLRFQLLELKRKTSGDETEHSEPMSGILPDEMPPVGKKAPEGTVSPEKYTKSDAIKIKHITRIVTDEPLLKSREDIWWESLSVINPAAFRLEGDDETVYIMYRAAEKSDLLKDGISRVGLGIAKIDHTGNLVPGPGSIKLFSSPIMDVRKGEFDEMGCEDPRVDIIDGKVVVSYAGVHKSPNNGDIVAQTAIAIMEVDVFKQNLAEWKPGLNDDIWNWERFLVDGKEYNKDLVVFKGKKRYWMVDRPIYIIGNKPRHRMRFRHALSLRGPWKKLPKYISPRGKDPHKEEWVGAGTNTVLLKSGRLMLYHSAVGDSRPENPDRRIYFGHMVLLDRDDPTRVLWRSTEPVLSPELFWEKNGWNGDLDHVFPAGMILLEERPDEKDPTVSHVKLLMFYGARDEFIGAAIIELEIDAKAFERDKLTDEDGKYGGETSAGSNLSLIEEKRDIESTLDFSQKTIVSTLKEEVIPMLGNALITASRRIRSASVKEIGSGSAKAKDERETRVAGKTMATENVRKDKKRKISIFIDKSLGDNRVKEVREALSDLTRSGDPLLKRWLKNIVIHPGEVNAEELRYLEDKKYVRKEDMIIITRTADLECLKPYEGISVITKVDDADLEPSSYYPLPEIVLFSLARAKVLNFTQEDLVGFYHLITNIEKLNEKEIMDLCWDKKTNTFKNTIIIKLGIPDAEQVTAVSETYNEIADYIGSNA
ncbi:MAG: hypothetical protein ABH862_00820 [Candidatus Omnitrophota bacterium]